MVSRALIWRFGIAGISLMAAIAVYCFARTYPPELLTPLQATGVMVVNDYSLSGSAPSFLYTLAVGLIIGACASSQINAQVNCLAWILIALVLEFTQHPIISGPTTTLVKENLSESTWEFVGSYWSRGVFDQYDLLATALGGALALAIPALLKLECSHESP